MGATYKSVHAVSAEGIHSVDGDKTYDQVAGKDLQHLGLQAGATREDLLKDANEQVAQRRTDKHAVESHLRHTRAEVVAVLANIIGDPRSDEFLQTGQHTGCQHLRAQRVQLQFTQVELDP